MTANWAFAPVCGFDFWRVIVTSPEVLIFLFFMITDPKTCRRGGSGGSVFGLLVGVASTLLMAPQTDEFGTKVGLLAGLVVVCAARPLLDRLVPEPRSAADELGRFASRLARRQADAGVLRGDPGVGLRSAPSSCSASASSPPASRRAASSRRTGRGPRRVPHEVDPATFPAITVEQDVMDWDHRSPDLGARSSS